MLNILCVMKTGGVYNLDYVQRLQNSVARNLTIPHQFVCLTDFFGEECAEPRSNIIFEPLKYNLPGWWSKVEMWRPDLEHYGRFLFLDLDQVITGSLDEIASYEGGVAVTYDFGGEMTPECDVPSQTVLNFTPGALREIWENFNKDPNFWMEEGDKMQLPYWGDQILMSKAYSGKADKYQDLVPGQIVSFKIHCNEGLPKNARIVSFHGNPKPHGVSLDWVARHWK